MSFDQEGYVHGAYDSGHDTAKEVLECVQYRCKHHKPQPYLKA